MPWDPETYNRFKDKRSEPFYDLLSHVRVEAGHRILDLGCGTGELTTIVADRFPDALVVGIDNSPEMLSKIPERKNLRFAQRSIEEQVGRPEQWNIIIANASLQWVNDHQQLFPLIISKLMPGGQLAVQMPSQKENILNQLLYELVHESPYFEALDGAIRHSPILTLDKYTQLLFEQNARELTVYQKVYPIFAETTDTLYDFISGSSLVPYMEKLPGHLKDDFISAFKKKIAGSFKASPMVYAFKRIIVVAGF